MGRLQNLQCKEKSLRRQVEGDIRLSVLGGVLVVFLGFTVSSPLVGVLNACGL